MTQNRYRTGTLLQVLLCSWLLPLAPTPLCTLVATATCPAPACAALTWEMIGPAREVNAVAVAPATGDSILAVAFDDYERNVYRTEDAGATWDLVAGMSGVRDVLFDPERPRFALAVGDSIYRSSDGGVTWVSVTNGIGAQVLSADPTCSRRLFVGTTLGRVLRSCDRGLSWVDIGVEPPPGSMVEISDIVVDPSDSNRIYVSTFHYETGGAGIYKTSDGGANWSRTDDPGQEGVPPGALACVSRLHMSAENPERLIAGAGSYNFGVVGAVYETSTGGDEWDALVLSGIPYHEDLRTLVLEPHPHRVDTVVLGYDHHGGPQYLYYSVDSGRGWTTLTDPVTNESEHGRDAAFDNLSRVYYTTADGVVRSSVPDSPVVSYQSHVIDDTSGGNGDGHLDPGESALVQVELRCRFGTARSVAASLATTDALVDVTQPYASFPDMVWGERASGLATFGIEVHAARQPGPVEFVLEIVADGAETTAVFYADPEVLLIDDDDFGAYESRYQRALEGSHLAYRMWQVVPDGPVEADLINSYDAVVWFTSDMQPGIKGTTLSSDEELLLAGYLDGGGSLFLSSQDYLNEEEAGLSDFAAGYLHLGGRFLNTAATGVTGVSADPIGDGMVFDPLLYDYPNTSDSVFPDPSAARVFTVTGGGAGAATRYPASAESTAFRTVFFAFPFEAIPTGGVHPGTRSEVMRRVLNWLVPDGQLTPTGVASSHPAIEDLASRGVSCHPVPSRSSVRIQTKAPRNTLDAAVTVYSTSGRIIWRGCANRDGDSLSAVWDGRDTRGRDVSSGVYLVRVVCDGRARLCKAVIIR